MTSPVLTFPLHYPVTATFSILALGQTVRVNDSLGTLILYVKQIFASGSAR